MSKATQAKTIPVEGDIEPFSNGSDVHVLRYTVKRGFLRATKTYAMKGGQVYGPQRVDALADLRDLEKSLEDELKEFGYPADGSPQAKHSWLERINATAFPVEDLYIKANLLHHLGLILARDLHDSTLHDVRQVVRFWGRLLISAVNGWAVKGRKTQQALANGPESRKQSGEQKLAIVRKHAKRYWAENAALRRDRSCTAEAIAESVNQELVAVGHRPMRPKTISNYIAKVISGKLL